MQLEVLQIDDSTPAIRFNVISQPNQVVRAATAAKTSGSLTAAQQLQLDFWTLFQRRLLERKVVPSAQTARPSYWFDVPLGRTGFVLSNIVDTYAGRIGVRLYLSNRVAEAALPQLEQDRVAIESEIGATLVWNPTPEKRDKIIGLFRKVDLENREAWPEYCEWLVDNVARFRQVFMPRVRALKLSEVATAHD